MALFSDMMEAADQLQDEIRKLKDREESYRMALRYLADANEIPSSLRLIAQEALKQ